MKPSTGFDLVRGIGLSRMSWPVEWAAPAGADGARGQASHCSGLSADDDPPAARWLVATVRELEADLTDAALSMFDGFVGRAWRRRKSVARNGPPPWSGRGKKGLSNWPTPSMPAPPRTKTAWMPTPR